MTSISTLIRTAAADRVLSLLREPITDHTARQLSIASNRIAATCVALVRTKTSVEASTNSALIDSELEIDDELERLKDSMRGLRLEVLHLQATSTPPADVQRAIKSLQKVLEDTYTATNQLQWEIAEHDASHAPRGKPLIATNQEELDTALNAIRRKK